METFTTPLGCPACGFAVEKAMKMSPAA